MISFRYVLTMNDGFTMLDDEVLPEDLHAVSIGQMTITDLEEQTYLTSTGLRTLAVGVKR